MRLKLTLVSGTAAADVVVTVDGRATVAEVAERLRVSQPGASSAATAGPTLCLRVAPGTTLERVVPPATPMTDAGIRSGDRIVLTNADPGIATRAAVATLRVVAGADAGKSFGLPAGTTLVGRDRSCEIRLTDPLVSKRHVKVNVTDMVEVIDDDSANGTQVGPEFVQRSVVRPTDVVRIGDTEFTITLHQMPGGIERATTHAIEFNRSPRLDPTYAGIELIAPEPPQRPQPQRFPLITMVAPLLMGAIMYAVTKNALSILFVALSPIMIAGSFFENRWSTARALAQATAQFRAGLRDLAVQLQYALEVERTQRRREHPSVDEVAGAVDALTPLVWTRRPAHASFLDVRLGLGTMPTRSSIKLPTTNNTMPELWRELHDVAGQFATVDRVPVVASLRECGNIGVAGPAVAAHPVACGVVSQLTGLHSPAELVLAALTTPLSAARWEWVKWLPHAGSDHSPLKCEHLAASSAAGAVLLAALEDLVAVRSATDERYGRRVLPAVALLVEDDAAGPVRARLVALAERGPAVGVHLLWFAPTLERIPAPCRAYVEVDPNTGAGTAGFVDGGVAVERLELEPFDPARAHALARRLAPVVDSGAPLEDASDLPGSVSFLTLTGPEPADQVDDIVARWVGSNSLPAATPRRLKRDNTLRALVGQSGAGRFYLDLREQGPHALVGGTTGAGKSEFLQTWILGMAAAHSPKRVTFLFVDYKGGAAFEDFKDLPHNVGLFTDLSPHLVRRALGSLNAELTRREHVLNAKRAKDLLELERRGDPDAPPSLVIIVDEFAALVTEVPEFVDGVVNVAQRGRSLGLHLILATQRPAGVIKENLRANTNLRVALRMADEDDSTDVLGTPQAGTIDPSLPGRGIAKTGPGRLTSFQTAYVGGRTSATPQPPSIDVHELPFGVGTAWDVPEVSYAPVADPGPTDIRRVVANIAAATRKLELPPPTRPWLPELDRCYRLEDLPSRRTDAELVFGVIDLPKQQVQEPVAFLPDRDGNMAVYGTGGSGKSTFLRTMAVAAGLAPARGGPCHVYALDFGSRMLTMLERLPHVGAVVTPDDTERTARLVKMLRAAIDERTERYSAIEASTIQEYRDRSGNHSEPRLLLLIDNFGAFRQLYEMGKQSRVFETVESIAADGRGVGVHVVSTADQAAAFTADMNSVTQCHLALRLSADIDHSVLGVPLDLFDERTPPGRGYMNGSEIQVGVVGGDPNNAKQAGAIAKLSAAMGRAGVAPALRIARLSERVTLTSLPPAREGAPWLGTWDETLEPLAFEPNGAFLVTGPSQSGRTTTVRTMVMGLRMSRPHTRLVLFGPKRSELADAVAWERHAFAPGEQAEVALKLAGEITSESPDVGEVVVVLEGLADLNDSMAQDELLELVRACRLHGHFVLAEGEISTVQHRSGLVGAVKANKYGIAMQPEQQDGDAAFDIDFPRVARADFPVGRGIFVRSGRTYRVQVATTT